MMTLIDFYWPLLVAAWLIGIASGMLAFSSRRGRPNDNKMGDQ